MRFFRSFVLFAIASILFVQTLNAATYTYTGNNFTYVSYTTSDSLNTSHNLNGSFSLDSPLPANQPLLDISGYQGFSYYFWAGTHVDPGDNSMGAYIDSFLIQTDSLGNIADWEIDIGWSRIGQSEIVRSNMLKDWAQESYISGGAGGWTWSYYDNFAYVENNPGTWTSDVAITVPAPSALFLSCLGMMGCVRRRSRQTATSL